MARLPPQKKVTPTGVAILLCLAPHSHGQDPYPDYVGAGHASGISVTSSGFDEGSEPIKTVDASGLSGDTHSSGFDLGWLSPSTAANPVPGRTGQRWLRYDLGHLYRLGRSTIWNYNEAGATEFGLRSVTIDTSPDGTTWTELGTSEFPQAPGAPTYPGFAGPDFGGVSARYVVLTANTNWGASDYWGLAEIRIDVATATAADGPMLAIVSVTSDTVQLMARSAADASNSQLQSSSDLRTWYATANIAGPGVQQQIGAPAGSGDHLFYRLVTKNDAGSLPQLATNSFAIGLGGTLPIGPTQLQATDADNTPGELTYTVSMVSGGRFELTSAPGTAISSFTQAQVDAGLVQFVHDGSANPPAFKLGLADGMNTLFPVVGNVSFDPNPPANMPPQLVSNSLTVTQGATVPVGGGNLLATDPDDPDAGLRFTVSALSAGRFELSTAPGVAITQFAQSQVTAGTVRFVHDNSTNAPAYSVSVSDGSATTAAAPATATFVPAGGGGSAPALVANSLATSVGSTVVLGPAQLDAVDPDSPSTSLTYTVSGVTGGRFERIASPGAAVTTFGQGDIENRALRFVQDGSTTRPAYQVSVSDGTNPTPPDAASVSFCDGTRTSMMTAGEMAAFNNLIQLSQVTHTVVASGRWSDPAVWGGGSPPTAGARIHVPAGLAVVVDGRLAPEFESIRIDGMLRFAPHVDTRLMCDTIVSTHCGRFEVGTAGIPIGAGVNCEIVFADDGPIDTNFDSAQMGRGAVLHGKTVVHGGRKTNKVALATHPAAGASTLQLESAPVGWVAGDELIVTGTLANNPTSDEIRTITAINGTAVTLDRALSLDHIAPRPDLNVYVANATRNVVFRSENATVARRGHIMIMHTLEADINYARFYQLGRTDKTRRLDDVTFDFESGDQPGNEGSAPIHFTTTAGARTNIRGRYVIHLHRGGTDPTTTPAVVRGCVAFDGPGWGFVSHSAHARFIDNVSYAIQGTGFYTEAGDEIGEMVGNIAIRSVNPAFAFDSEGGAIDPDLGFEQQEFGNDGDGYWLSGNLVAMRNNVSAGSSAHGIIFWVDGLVEADIPRGRASVKVAEIPGGHLIPGRATVPTWWAPLAEVSGNECYGSAIGFRARYIHAQTYVGEGGSAFHASPPQAYIDTLNPTIDRLTVWGNRDGVLLNYCQRVSVKNSLIVGIGAPFVLDGGTANSGVGLDKGTEVSRGSGRVENVTIEGFEMGFVVPRNDQWTFENLTLKNVTDMLVAEPRQGPRTITMSNITFGDLTGTAVAGRGGRRNIVMAADFTALGYQPFWFLMPDRITLDGEGVYYDAQAAGFTPLTGPPDPEELIQPVPSTYVNRTNQQLHDAFGLSFGGAFIPQGARTDSRVVGGVVGPAAPVPTALPTLLDMTNEGGSPEPPKGGPAPELTGNRLEIRRGQSVTLMATNLNATDTNTPRSGLTYTVTGVTHGRFSRRTAPATAITSFTQAEVDAGFIRFVHDGSTSAPAYSAAVSDGATTTAAVGAIVRFSQN